MIDLIEPSERVCNNVTSKAAVRNFGSQTISTIRFKIKIGSKEQLYDWSGNIPSLGKADIDLPLIDISSLSDGVYDFSLEIQLVNGISDNEVINNIQLVPVEKKSTSSATPSVDAKPPGNCANPNKLPPFVKLSSKLTIQKLK